MAAVRQANLPTDISGARSYGDTDGPTSEFGGMGGGGNFLVGGSESAASTSFLKPPDTIAKSNIMEPIQIVRGSRERGG